MTIEDRPDNAPSLQLVLEGGLARLGEVPALDVARLIEGSIRAIARAAEMIAGREPGQVGRRGSATENATRFVLDGSTPEVSLFNYMRHPRHRLRATEWCWTTHGLRNSLSQVHWTHCRAWSWTPTWPEGLLTLRTT